MTSVVIVGGGPGGYEAALVARQLGADVTLVDRDGPGGSAVLTDAVPSKTLVATANAITAAASSANLGVLIDGRSPEPSRIGVDLRAVNERIAGLVRAQSDDIRARLLREGITLMPGRGRLDGDANVVVARRDGKEETLGADAVLIATGARPRVLPDAQPDGERILTWEQVYALDEVPERLIVVGSGVTGAEFAGAYHALGSRVVLISSRDRVLPGEDPDAARVLEEVFAPPRPGGARLVPGDRCPPHRRRRRGHAGVRRRRARLACAHGRRLAAEHRRSRARSGWRRDRRRRVHPRRPGQPHHPTRGLCGR